MVHVGLDLSRTRLDVHVMDEAGRRLAVTTAVPDRGGLAVLADRVGEFGGPVYAAIESMNGARFVHDQLELAGWQVAIADAQKVKGLAPLACKTDKIDSWVLAELCPPGPGAGDLAAHPDGARGTRTRPVAAAPGAPPQRVEEPR
jgi:transposase